MGEEWSGRLEVRHAGVSLGHVVMVGGKIGWPFWRCVIVRGQEWQKDTLPAPPICTGLINIGGRVKGTQVGLARVVTDRATGGYAFSSGLAVTKRPSASTISTPSKLSMVRPYWRDR